MCPDLIADAQRLASLFSRLDRALDEAGRDPQSVGIVWAVKTQTWERVVDRVSAWNALLSSRGWGAAAAWKLGHNRVQELTAMHVESLENPIEPVDKVDLVPAVDEVDEVALEWHLIGPLQSNKINQVMRVGAVIETVDSPELAEKIAARVPAELSPLPVMIQVNAAGEATKSGCTPEEAAGLARAIEGMDTLRLTGVMGIGAMNPAATNDSFHTLYRIKQELADLTGRKMELSAGMSNDFPQAIAAGATLLRLGAALFGPRQ